MAHVVAGQALARGARLEQREEPKGADANDHAQRALSTEGASGTRTILTGAKSHAEWLWNTGIQTDARTDVCVVVDMSPHIAARCACKLPRHALCAKPLVIVGLAMSGLALASVWPQTRELRAAR